MGKYIEWATRPNLGYDRASGEDVWRKLIKDAIENYFTKRVGIGTAEANKSMARQLLEQVSDLTKSNLDVRTFIETHKDSIPKSGRRGESWVRGTMEDAFEMLTYMERLQENIHLKNETARLEGEKQKAQDEAEQLKAKLEKSNKRKMKYMTHTMEAVVEASSAKMEAAQAEADRGVLKDALKEATKQVAELSDSSEEVAGALGDAKAQISQLKVANAKLATQLSESDEQNKALQEVVQTQGTKILQQAEEIHALKGMLQAFKTLISFVKSNAGAFFESLFGMKKGVAGVKEAEKSYHQVKDFIDGKPTKAASVASNPAGFHHQKDKKVVAADPSPAASPVPRKAGHGGN